MDLSIDRLIEATILLIRICMLSVNMHLYRVRTTWYGRHHLTMCNVLLLQASYSYLSQNLCPSEIGRSLLPPKVLVHSTRRHHICTISFCFLP